MSKRIKNPYADKLPVENYVYPTRYTPENNPYGFTCRFKFNYISKNSEWCKIVMKIKNNKPYTQTKEDLLGYKTNTNALLSALGMSRAQIICYDRKSNTYNLTSLGNAIALEIMKL